MIFLNLWHWTLEFEVLLGLRGTGTELQMIGMVWFVLFMISEPSRRFLQAVVNNAKKEHVLFEKSSVKIKLINYQSLIINK